MKQKTGVYLRTAFALIMMLILIAACTAPPGGEPAADIDPTPTELPTEAPDDPVSSDDPTATPAPDPDPGEEEMIIQDAVITGVDIAIMESFPLQASAQIDGELGDGCTELAPIETEREGDTFYITMQTMRPADAVCTMELRFFSESVRLDIEGLEAGTYTVDVNGVTETFTLEQDNVLDLETEEPDQDVALSDEDRSELIGLTLERALVDQEIPDYALLADQEQLVLSTENIDPALVPEIPDVTLALLTPEEIQELADAEGDFLYLRFQELEGESADKAVVSLANTWAVAADSDMAYLSGGGFTIEYSRDDAGAWTGDVTESWIS
ncbi:MAG: hypothetical protein ACOC9Z_01240 [Chloroflexota bacterium]